MRRYQETILLPEFFFNARQVEAQETPVAQPLRCGQEGDMVIQSRTIVGAAAAFALVGAAVWGSTMLAHQPAKVQAGHVEISAVDEKAWSVEVTQLGDDTNITRTAANR
jgi:hypothetical protein